MRFQAQTTYTILIVRAATLILEFCKITLIKGQQVLKPQYQVT